MCITTFIASGHRYVRNQRAICYVRRFGRYIDPCTFVDRSGLAATAKRHPGVKTRTFSQSRKPWRCVEWIPATTPGSYASPMGRVWAKCKNTQTKEVKASKVRYVPKASK